MRGQGISGLLLFSALALGGCGRFVGKMAYFDTAMSPALSMVRDQPPIREPEPVATPTIPREGLLLPPLHEEDQPAVDDNVSISNDRLRYGVETSNRLEAMRNDLRRIWALATQKGAIGVAAFDPNLRAFNTSVRLIERYFFEAVDDDPAQWPNYRVKIDAQMRRAADAVREALQDVQRVDDAGHLANDGSLTLYFE